MLSTLSWWYSNTGDDAGDDACLKSEEHVVKLSQNNETVCTINGKQYTVDGMYPLFTSLNTFIRDVANLKGTKFMCEEGGCGCCIVSVSAKEPATGSVKTFAVNSCLVFVLSCHGWSITTVEGLGSKQKGYHPLQVALARFNGSQCGYCSPGMVMNMYSLLEAKRNRTMQEVENSFGGNICRCTGYRPIMDAFKSFTVDAPAVLRDKCADIEDIGRFKCPYRYSRTGQETASQEEVAGELVSALAVPVHIVGANGDWYRVDSVSAIFDVFNIIGDRSYQLVAGNTARGAYPVAVEPQVYIDISPVPELQTVVVNSGNIMFGGNITLENFMSSLRSNASKAGYEYFTQIASHVDLVANVPVRNVGTVAGNLLLKHQHKEFQSDIFLLLEVVGANLIIRNSSGNVTSILPEGFLKLDMKKKVITQFVLYPRSQYTLRSYKIMARAQNVHAVVNAGFFLKLSTDGNGKVLEKPRIVYGAITPEFVHASNTETYLTGKNLYQQQTLRGALQQLNSELQPDDNPPEMGPVYRKSLAEGLFYKCVLNIARQKAKKTFVSGGTVLSRPVSSGRQAYQTNPTDYPLGQPVLKLEALPQCSGEAQFVHDRLTVPGELHAALVLSTVPNGKIVSIDATEALKYPGVVAFYKAQDIPGRNNITPNPTTFTVEDEELFCSGTVLYNGQPVGVIVAENRQAANKAKKLVKIKYSGITKPTIFLRDVIPEVGNLGDTKEDTTEPSVDTNTSDIDAVAHVVEGKFDMGFQYHYHMETHTCSVVPTEDGFEVHASSQWMDLCQWSIATVLGIKEHRVLVIVRRMGGAFGAKISRYNFVACSCALAAHYLRRSVRMVLTMEDNMRAIGKRPEVATDYKVGVDANGKIQYLEADLYENNGSSNNDPQAAFASLGFVNCYNNSNWTVVTKNVLTNTPSSAYMRAPGTIDGTASIEYIMEHIAKVCNMDPIQVRRNNIKSGDPILKMIDDLITSSQYTSRKQQIDQFNTENRWLKKGIALMPMNFAIPFDGNLHCIVAIYAGDGSVAVSHGGTECGQGINTKVAQVVSYTLKIPLSLVVVKSSNTVTAANDICTGASITSDMACYAAIECCKELLSRLAPTASSLPNATWEGLLSAAVNNGVDLVASRMFASKKNGQQYGVYGVSVVEIITDVLTGMFQITRADVLEDAGKSISPNIDIGQIEGAFVMGLGLWSSERIVIDPTTGECLTNRSWNYYPPGAKDIPIDFRVEIQRNMPNPVGVLRSKTTGEPPLCLSLSLVFALRNALESARKDAGNDGSWFRITPPLTVEQLWLYSLTSPSQFSLQ